MNIAPLRREAMPYLNERCTVISTSDPCQHAASLNGWMQDYLQLSAGHFSGEIVEASIGPLQVFKETIHQRVDEKANPRRDSYTIGVPIHVKEDGYWQGRLLKPDSLITLRPNEELYFRTPPVSSILVTVIDCTAFDHFARITDSAGDIQRLISRSNTGGLPPEAAQRFRTTLQGVLALRKH